MASAAAPVAALRSLAHRAGIYGLLAVMLVAALLFVPGFATPTNLANVVTQSAALGLVAIGQTFVIAGGLIDLSVGQLLGLSVVLSCAFTEGRSELLLPVLAAMVALGAGVGVSSGVGSVVDVMVRSFPLALTLAVPARPHNTARLPVGRWPAPERPTCTPPGARSRRGGSFEGQSVAEGPGHQVCARAGAELRHRIAHVGADGVVGDLQLAGDL